LNRNSKFSIINWPNLNWVFNLITKSYGLWFIIDIYRWIFFKRFIIAYLRLYSRIYTQSTLRWTKSNYVTTYWFSLNHLMIDWRFKWRIFLEIRSLGTFMRMMKTISILSFNRQVIYYRSFHIFCIKLTIKTFSTCHWLL